MEYDGGLLERAEQYAEQYARTIGNGPLLILSYVIALSSVYSSLRKFRNILSKFIKVY